eukprot:8417377-Pyramimonas_sp.AAC.1
MTRLTCGPNNAITPSTMHNLTAFGFAIDARRLDLHCKAAACGVCCKRVAFHRNERLLAAILEGDDWAVAHRSQQLYNNSILEYIDSVWTELSAIPGIPSDPLLVGLQAKAMQLCQFHRAPSSCRRSVFTRSKHFILHAQSKSSIASLCA